MSKTAPLPRQTRLLSSCAVAVIAALTVHMPVRAQTAPPASGFQGTVLPGQTVGATLNAPTNTTLVTVNNSRAIVTWGTDTPGTFLTEGGRVDYVNSADRVGQDYIVFNRILPSNNATPVTLNGTIRSTLSNNTNGAVGGQLWFYSPSGILVGSAGSLNVGSLLLTANDLTNKEGFLGGTATSFNFASDGGSRAAVEVQGTINTVSRNAYVAMIAPRVVQSGNVTVNGTAAYVAAEKVDMTISGSLFNISVPADGGSSYGGTRPEDAALVHTGNTTLRNQEVGYGAPDQGQSPQSRAAIMVAVPKNDAVTMLVQGNVLYTQATEVAQVNGKIILSGGNNVRLESGSGASFPGDPTGAAGSRFRRRPRRRRHHLLDHRSHGRSAHRYRRLRLHGRVWNRKSRRGARAGRQRGSGQQCQHRRQPRSLRRNLCERRLRSECHQHRHRRNRRKWRHDHRRRRRGGLCRRLWGQQHRRRRECERRHRTHRQHRQG
jgi:filamentous hemagglutinin family protein